jgi:hypothetical protein
MPSISGARKTGRGRPKVGSTSLNVRLPPEQLDGLDAFVADQSEDVSRPEAIRLIVTKFLRSKGYLPK